MRCSYLIGGSLTESQLLSWCGKCYGFCPCIIPLVLEILAAGGTQLHSSLNIAIHCRELSHPSFCPLPEGDTQPETGWCSSGRPASISFQYNLKQLQGDLWNCWILQLQPHYRCFFICCLSFFISLQGQLLRTLLSKLPTHLLSQNLFLWNPI